MEKVIIGIHGLANKPPKNELSEAWRASIDEGFQKTLRTNSPDYTLEMVYWADRLYRQSLHSDSNFDFDDLYNKEPYLEGPAELRDYEAGLVDQARIAGPTIFGGAFDFVKETFGVHRVADWVLRKTLKDLDFYYDAERKILNRANPPQKQVARAVLQHDLRQVLQSHQGKQIMLIAHSMGTIISYDVLRDIGRTDPDFEVAEYVTIGSPLGLPFVKGKIIDERKYPGEDVRASDRLRSPTIVSKSWTNYWDRRDPVALDGHLRDDYKANARGIRVIDDMVENSYTGRSGEPNYHKSYGYLRAPEMTRQIATFLAG